MRDKKTNGRCRQPGLKILRGDAISIAMLNDGLEKVISLFPQGVSFLYGRDSRRQSSTAAAAAAAFSGNWRYINARREIYMLCAL